jgi:hypothetical protein
MYGIHSASCCWQCEYRITSSYTCTWRRFPFLKTTTLKQYNNSIYNVQQISLTAKNCVKD